MDTNLAGPRIDWATRGNHRCTTAVDGCRCGAIERTASGYKKPHCAGGCWPAAPPLRGPFGVTRRGQPSGVALQEQCPAPPDALVLLAMVVSGAGYTVWGVHGSLSLSWQWVYLTPCVVNERAVQVLSTPRRDSGWKRTCNMCGCRCPVPCRCAIAHQGTAPSWGLVCAAPRGV